MDIQAKQQDGPFISTDDVYGLVNKTSDKKISKSCFGSEAKVQNVRYLFDVRERNYLHGIGSMGPKPVLMLVKMLYF